MHSKKINQLVAIAILIKISLIVVAVLFSNIGWYHLSDESLLWKNINTDNVFAIFFNSDSGWYRVIATNGYKHIPAADLAGWSHPELHFAFFPLFPFCVGAIMKISGLSFEISGFIFSLIILYFVVKYFYLYLIEKKLNESDAFRTVIVLLIFPFSLHFYFLYTEALFFTLLIASFYFLEKKQWGQFALSAGLLVLTRPNGLFMALPFFLMMIEQQGAYNLTTIKKVLSKLSNYVLLIMPLVFFGWMVYQKMVTGKFFAFKYAQEIGWHKSFVSPFKVMFQEGKTLDQFQSFYISGFLLVSVLMLRKWKPSIQTFIWLNILLPLTAGSLTSITRYLSILFPYHILLTSVVWVRNNFRWIVVIFIILQLYCFKLWLEDFSLMY